VGQKQKQVHPKEIKKRKGKTTGGLKLSTGQKGSGKKKNKKTQNQPGAIVHAGNQRRSWKTNLKKSV